MHFLLNVIATEQKTYFIRLKFKILWQQKAKKFLPAISHASSEQKS
jgi:hypothetical protein